MVSHCDLNLRFLNQKEIKHVFISLKVICVSYSYILPIFLLHHLSFFNWFIERFLSFQYIIDPIPLLVTLLQIYPTSFYLVFSPILRYLLNKLKFLNSFISNILSNPFFCLMWENLLCPEVRKILICILY